MSFKIIGTGSYLPPLTVTNDDLAKTIDTSDEWITQRIGIKSRRISEDESTAEMGYKAAKEALTESGTAPEELDLIIAASITGDTICPTTAGGIQKLPSWKSISSIRSGLGCTASSAGTFCGASSRAICSFRTTFPERYSLLSWISRVTGSSKNSPEASSSFRASA